MVLKYQDNHRWLRVRAFQLRHSAGRDAVFYTYGDGTAGHSGQHSLRRDFVLEWWMPRLIIC